MVHWAPHDGLQNTTLCDSSTLHEAGFGEDEELMEADADDHRSRSNKRKKPNDKNVEPAEGVKIIGEAINSKGSILRMCPFQERLLRLFISTHTFAELRNRKVCDG
ncbi:hypothetical protein L917_18305 [Phytophthora nicotianae]|uniref:Uncharacterized protein n=1 Tax=Phytophthora nicotianae TaxID=4792 RepID=W2KAE2_PHYNI|nr:hypothetical protein L917_18305 [Phytophthora nicotianae]